MMRFLGEGSTATVEKAFDLIEKRFVAIKLFKPRTNSDNKNFMNEVSVLKHFLKEDGMIQMYEFGTGYYVKNDSCEKYNYIVFEYAPNYDHFSFVYYCEAGFGDKNGRFLAKKILISIEACHNMGITHKDIKPENILLANEWDIKLSDFGYAIKMAD